MNLEQGLGPSSLARGRQGTLVGNVERTRSSLPRFWVRGPAAAASEEFQPANIDIIERINLIQLRLLRHFLLCRVPFHLDSISVR